MSAATFPSIPEQGHPRRWSVLVVLCAVAFMAQLDLFIVNVAVPALGKSFPSAGLTSISWVLNAYSIVFAALLVPAGRLADHFGRRRFLLAGVAVFTLASAACAAAPSLPVLVAARALQAVGAAMIVPTSLGLLLPTFPQRQHTMVVGIWAGVAAVAASAGPTVGGLLVALDWRWVFLVNVPIGVAVVLAGRVVLPEVRAHVGARLPDAVSSLAVFGTIALLTLATVQGETWGWTSGRELALIVVFAVLAVVSVRRTLTRPNALIEAGLFRSRAFTVSSIALLLFFLAFSAWLLATILFFEDVWHDSALIAGLSIAPAPIMSAAFALNSGRLAGRFGRTPLAIVGPLLVAASAVYWLVAATQHRDYVTGFLPGLIIAGAGSGMTQAPLFAAASTLPRDRATTGSAVLNMSRQVGSALGVAILVALFATAHPDTLGPFHRGWVFMAVCATAAALVVIGGALVRRPASVREAAAEPS